MFFKYPGGEPFGSHRLETGRGLAPSAADKPLGFAFCWRIGASSGVALFEALADIIEKPEGLRAVSTLSRDLRNDGFNRCAVDGSARYLHQRCIGAPGIDDIAGEITTALILSNQSISIRLKSDNVSQ